MYSIGKNVDNVHIVFLFLFFFALKEDGVELQLVTVERA